MKILQILGGPLHSGAGRAVRSLQEKLLSKGVNSQVYGRVEAGLENELRAVPISTPLWFVSGVCNRIQLLRLKRKHGDSIRNLDFMRYGLNVHRMPGFQTFDLLHIQWVDGSTLGRNLLNFFSNETRPIVWTLRDMWPFTGGCHFSGDCRGYETGCIKCPLLSDEFSPPQPRSEATFKKEKISRNYTFVAISKHVARQASNSNILRGHRIEVIPNSVMLDQFKPINKNLARTSLGLPQDKFIIATGALNIAEPRKGSATLTALLDEYRDDRELHWSIFGKGVEQLAGPIPSNCTFFGEVRDNLKLNQIYAAADLFVMPSLQESFGKVTIEAMASGTPVAAYSSTPAEEMITEDKTGWFAPHGDVKAFIEAVRQIRMMPRASLASAGVAAHEHAQMHFSADAVADEHVALYESLLKDRPLVD